MRNFHVCFHSVLVSRPPPLVPPSPLAFKAQFQCYFLSVSVPVLLYTWETDYFLDITMYTFNSNQQICTESLDV